MRNIISLVVLTVFCTAIPSICQDRVVENGRYLGSILMCDDGYKNVGGRCEPLPSVTNGRYLGSLLMCDDGYRNVAGRCEPLPSVTNGRYLGSILICDDGYRNVAGQCDVLPSVPNSRYVGSILICDDGFRNVGGRCNALPMAANSTYLGDALVCEDGFVFRSGQCVRSAIAQPAIRRFDPAVVNRSQRAPAATDPYILFDPYFSSAPSIQYRSGSKFDPTTGNNYTWRRRPDGSTVVNGVNYSTGSMWNTTIRQDGSMNGFDKNMNPWTYNAKSGFYMNYGTGKICVGKGAARSCF